MVEGALSGGGMRGFGKEGLTAKLKATPTMSTGQEKANAA